MIKRYMIFSGATYYASGGASDYESQHDDKFEAIRIAEIIDSDWVHVWDALEDVIVWTRGQAQS